MVPTGASLFASDTALLCRLPCEQVECQAAQGREVLGSMARTGPRLVFSEADVHVPVHLVLDPPVAAHRFGEAGYVAREAGEVVPAFRGGVSFDYTDSLDDTDAAQACPLRAIGEPLDIFALPVAPCLQAPMVLLHRFHVDQLGCLAPAARGPVRSLLADSVIEIRFDLFVHGLVIAFER